jgi:hypothetical protein
MRDISQQAGTTQHHTPCPIVPRRHPLPPPCLKDNITKPRTRCPLLAPCLQGSITRRHMPDSLLPLRQIWAKYNILQGLTHLLLNLPLPNPQISTTSIPTPYPRPPSSLPRKHTPRNHTTHNKMVPVPPARFRLRHTPPPLWRAGARIESRMLSRSG